MNKGSAGAPRKLDLRLPASIACDLARQLGVSDKAAAIAAWEALQGAEHQQPRELEGETVAPKFRNAAVDRLNSITRTMRAIRAGELTKIAYSAHWFHVAQGKLAPSKPRGPPSTT